jgi:YesN/AraC family two-component response regulator
MARILIIDDDQHIRATLREMLQRSGYEVSEAVNGKQGLRLFYEHPADLIITDILMPIMPGSRLISILRKDFPDLKIIAMSGGGSMYRSGSYLKLASDLGAQRILEKPFLQKELVEAIEDTLATNLDRYSA